MTRSESEPVLGEVKAGGDQLTYAVSHWILLKDKNKLPAADANEPG